MLKKIKKILSKKKKIPLVCLTAYSKNIAQIIDKNCDMILVGDSLANVLYGMKNTHKITLETMIKHTQSVRLGVKKSLLIVDMPKNTYITKKNALKNAKKIISMTGCEAVKLESNSKNYNIIHHLVKSGIPVMGHIGYTPQFKGKFRACGHNQKEKNKLIKEAKNIEKAGAFSIVLKCIASKTSKEITEQLKIVTVGIGSSVNCDGQILVTDDLLGLSGFYPKFVKKYVKLDKIIEKGVQKYKSDVLNKKFPKKKNEY